MYSTMQFVKVFIVCVLPCFTVALEKTVCEQKLETVFCPTGQIIQINSVLYGRTQSYICNPTNANYPIVSCVSTQVSTNAVKNRCHGRTGCLIQADNNVLGEDPCPGTPKYLTVRYQCVTALSGQVNSPTTSSSTPTTPTTTTPTTTTPVTTTFSNNLPPGILPVGGVGSPTNPINIHSSSHSNQTGVHLCHENLVSGPRGVPDGQLSASSQLSLSNNAHRGRLYMGIFKYSGGFTLEGGWTSASNDAHPWIQVKMNWLTMIKGITTQGRHVNSGNGCCQEWVTKYKLKHSIDGQTWETVKDKNGQDKIFIGNTDTDTPIFHMLDCVVVARFLRIEVVDYVGRSSLRFEVTGCPTNTDDIGKCPKGWTERPSSNTCYYISDQSDLKTWQHAKQTCKRRQGDIVKIETYQEKIWLQNELRKLQASQKLTSWWTGLNNRPRFDNNYYKWDDGSSLNTNVLNWYPGEPNNSGGKEHCAAYMLNSDAISDQDCDTARPFICEVLKYWQSPINIPSLVTARPTLPPTQAPAVVVSNKVPIPIGGNVVTSGTSIFATGCLKPADCIGKVAGDYPSCSGCGHYLTCAPSGTFPRQCPANLKYDDNRDACVLTSSTCRGP